MKSKSSPPKPTLTAHTKSVAGCRLVYAEDRPSLDWLRSKLGSKETEFAVVQSGIFILNPEKIRWLKAAIKTAGGNLVNERS